MTSTLTLKADVTEVRPRTIEDACETLSRNAYESVQQARRVLNILTGIDGPEGCSPSRPGLCGRIDDYADLAEATVEILTRVLAVLGVS